MNSTYVSEIRSDRNKKRTRRPKIAAPSFVPDTDPRRLQMARILAGFQFSEEYAELIASLAFGEVRS